MKRLLNSFLCLGLSAGLFAGCQKSESAVRNNNSPAAAEPTVEINKPVGNSNAKNQKSSKTDGKKTLDSQQIYECTRAEPKSIVKKSVYPKNTFRLSKDKRTGTETIAFDNKDKLIITNAGCEYYYLGFRFETGRFSGELTDTKYWFERAVELIEETKNGIDDTPIEMAKAATAIENYLKKTKEPKFGEEIDYGAGEIRTFVSVNKVQKLAKDKFALEIAFAVGPL